MGLRDIQNLIKFIARSGADEAKLETEDIKITIKTNPDEGGRKQAYVQQLPIAQQLTQLSTQQPLPTQTLPTATPEATEDKSASSEGSKYTTVRSPMIGTFHRHPGPDKPLSVGVGSITFKGSVICIIGAMRFFNEIEPEVSGKIVKILVDGSSPVGFDQPLCLVDPS